MFAWACEVPAPAAIPDSWANIDSHDKTWLFKAFDDDFNDPVAPAFTTLLVWHEIIVQ